MFYTLSSIQKSKVMAPENSRTSTLMKLVLSNRLPSVFIGIVLLCAIFGDFLANDKPLLCKVNDRWYTPVIQSYLVDLQISRWNENLTGFNWRDIDYQYLVMPPIPYRHNTIDQANSGFKSPLDRQVLVSWKNRHWLGTDQIGRDVLAGMIHGCRIVSVIGILSMLISGVIGIPLGLVAGYFGNRSIGINPLSAVILAAIATILYVLVWGSHVYLGAQVPIFLKLILTLAFILLIIRLLFVLQKVSLKNIIVPLDAWVLRLVEIFQSIPILLVIMALVAVYGRIDITIIALLLGILQWPSFAMFVRSEVLKIKGEAYIQAAQVMGLKHGKILWRHVLPNALGPVWIIFAFGVASSVLIESTLSFLGIGLAVEEVTWGSLLNEARKHFSAWWLALFPGLAIFFTVFTFNYLGDRLQDILDPKKIRWI
jgi:peptide/nickel transport system permease protein